MYLVPGTGHLVQVYLVPGTWYLVPSTRYPVPGSDEVSGSELSDHLSGSNKSQDRSTQPNYRAPGSLGGPHLSDFRWPKLPGDSDVRLSGSPAHYQEPSFNTFGGNLKDVCRRLLRGLTIVYRFVFDFHSISKTTSSHKAYE